MSFIVGFAMLLIIEPSLLKNPFALFLLAFPAAFAGGLIIALFSLLLATINLFKDFTGFFKKSL
ncbi:hypothetical protein RZR97_08160 [Hydrogenimonas thermophila]|uniref:hypothetical protein n=1 Tax=Hydrogenimonas thermophila TaxID=223786 RepID=UPI002936D989|nr:hypothetical protein [Hydrogenimonas thermophila]WOE69080.1 hypothetical protein RZR91_08185 [Hydrogenimonas thermophila]WOE71590.1 hypothetical protein RZR97_08160 [Hydrogenimonas thermophila]